MIQTRLLHEAPAVPARHRPHPRVRLLREGRSLTLPLPAAADPVTRPARVVHDTPDAPALRPADLMLGVAREAAGTYMLGVRGDAMRDALVCDGDVVMLQRGAEVGHGELAAVRVDGAGEVALRRVYFENGHVRLQSENHRLPPTVVPRGQVMIEGKVLAIVRNNGL